MSPRNKRVVVQDEFFVLRMPRSLKVEAGYHAYYQELGLSEYMRGAVERENGRMRGEKAGSARQEELAKEYLERNGV